MSKKIQEYDKLMECLEKNFMQKIDDNKQDNDFDDEINLREIICFHLGAIF